MRRGEFLHGRRAENSGSIRFPEPDHHLRELCQVIGGGEESGVSRDAAHVAGSWIVNHAAQWLAGDRIDLGGGDPGFERRGRLEHRFPHSQGLENVFTREISECLATQPMHNFTHQNEVDVTVNEAESRAANRFIGQGPVNARVVTAPDRQQVEIGPQAGKMRHQIADGNLAVASLKFGQIVGHGIVEANLALIEELHHRGCGGYYFGQGGGVEDGIHGHGLARGDQRPFAIGLAINHLAVMPNE